MLIVAALATLIGLSLGLLGGGGSILAVPVLTYGAGMGAKEAIATSLLVVGTTSVFALIQHARRGNVDWRTGAIFAVTAMVGAYGGGLAAGLFSGTTLLLLFAGMMVVTALAMLNGGDPPKASAGAPLRIGLVVAEGLLVGAATGLVGAGGGFLVVPALVLLGGMDMHRAVGTSLLVIALKSFAAYAGHAAHISVDLKVAGVVTVAAVLGSLVGGLVAHRIPAKALRKGFAVFVLAMAAYVLWREAGAQAVAIGGAVVLPVLAVMARRNGLCFFSCSKSASLRTTLVLSLLAWVACSKPPAPAPAVTKGAAQPAAPAPAAAQPADALLDIATLDLTLKDADHQVLRGKALVMDTHRLLPKNVGNGLNCTNCHLRGGTVPKAIPFVGVDDRYPKYRSRSGKSDDLPERINGCFERSMAGVRLDPKSPDMAAMVAYMNRLSRDVPDGTKVAGLGIPHIKPPAAPDATRGKTLYAAKCAACHQLEGQGIFGADDATVFPPLWGDRSFNIGAGMARLSTAAAFVKWNMPQGQEGSLSDQEAYDISAYFTVQERRDFAPKAKDWASGGKPADARY
jgi:uncharacterized protein